MALLPERVRMRVHGDSEFRSQTRFGWLRASGYDALLGMRGDQWISERAAGKNGQPLVRLVPNVPAQTERGRKRPHRRAPVRYLSEVSIGQEERPGPVTVIAWWERDDDGKVVLHAVMTNLAATARTKAYGTRRRWIETVFRDGQSGGVHLERSGLTDTARVARVRLVLASPYLWLVSLGRWLVQRGYRRLIDDGTRWCWHFSLCQLGVGWMERLHSFTQPLPIRLYLYP